MMATPSASSRPRSYAGRLSLDVVANARVADVRAHGQHALVVRTTPPHKARRHKTPGRAPDRQPRGSRQRRLFELAGKPAAPPLTPEEIERSHHGKVVHALLDEHQFLAVVSRINDLISALLDRFWKTGEPQTQPTNSPTEEDVASWRAWALDHVMSYVGPILSIVEHLVVESRRKSGGRLVVELSPKVKLVARAIQHVEEAVRIFRELGVACEGLQWELDRIGVASDDLASAVTVGSGKQAVIDLDLLGGCIYQQVRFGACMSFVGWQFVEPEDRILTRCRVCPQTPVVVHDCLSRKEACVQLDRLLDAVGVALETKTTGKRPSSSSGERSGTAANGIVSRFTKKYVRGPHHG